MRCPDTFYNTTPVSEMKGTQKKRKQKGCKSQRTRMSAKRLSSRYDREATFMKSQHGNLNKDLNNTPS